jgi:hypothetical protein
MLAGCSVGSASPAVVRGTAAASASASSAAGDAFDRALAYSQCMRSHGVPNFPDPQRAAGGTRVTIGNGVDPNSPQFQSAQQACQSLYPGGGMMISAGGGS